MEKNAGQSTDSGAETFYNRMQGKYIYTIVRRTGKTIYETQVCGSGRACFNKFKSEGHSFRARQEGEDD